MNLLYKTIVFSCLGLLFTGKGQAQDSLSVDSSYSNSHYNLRLDFFKKMPNQKKEIIFLGNSLTEGGKWQELFNRKHVINRGISGDVTYGILARLDEVLASRPAKIFLLCGVNDMKRGTPNAMILANFRKIINRVKVQSPGTKLLIQSLLPVNEEMLPPSYVNVRNVKIDDINNSLKALCNQTGVTYLDLHPAFADQRGNLRKELSIDGLHLRQASYILWADYLKKLNVLK